jgi:beta-glucosidase-like glycosyl hydrolase
MFPYLLLLPALAGAQSLSQSQSPSASASDSLTASSVIHSLTSASSLSSGSAAATTSGVLSSEPSESLSSILSSAAPSEPVSSASGDASFSPFPLPSGKPLPPIFPSTDPSKPPDVENSPGGQADQVIIPDFAPAWAKAYKKGQDFIANLTLEEKVNITTGVGWTGGRCVGNIPAVQDWPGLCLEDAPLGVRFADYVTSFPSGVNTAATWSRRLIRQRGVYMGAEFKGKGVNVALGPMMNMGRVAAGGRNWEGFGADPYLTGESAYETILGMQSSGVQACAKHFINNEQEHKRTTTSSDVSSRTQHEIYAHPFLRSVQAGVASVMCSYNLINGTYACENDETQNGILKKEYGFQGYIMSDWQATMSTRSAAKGLDMTMPGDITFNSGNSYFGGNLTAAVQRGEIDEARVDDMAIRILAGYYLLKQEKASYPHVNFDAFKRDDESVNEHVDVQGLSDTPENPNAHARLTRDIGAASAVLLKNNNDGKRYGGGPRGLPLGPRQKGVAGPLGRRDASGVARNLKARADQATLAVDSKSKLRSLVMIGSDAGPGSDGPNGFADRGGVDGVLAVGWGSGTSDFTYLVSPLEAIQRRARVDRTSVSWMLNDFNYNRASAAAHNQGAALVFIQSDSGEQYIKVDGNEGDRKNLTAWHEGDKLVQTVAAQNNNTIVVVHSVGPLILEPWVEHPNVTAVVWAGVPGQEAGNALADILWGEYNPSGRLPYTIAKKREDYSADLVLTGGRNEIVDIPYTEELLIDYRWFDAKNIEPRYEFGFGLSYTTFKYSGLKVSKVAFNTKDDIDAKLEKAWEKGETSPQAVGSSAALWLHRPAFEVSFKVKNTGSVAGTEIPQLYVNFPASAGEPPSVLRGFTDIMIKPGDTETVKFSLSRYDLSIWDVVSQGWKKPEGAFGLSVGASSRDFKLKGGVPL